MSTPVEPHGSRSTSERTPSTDAAPSASVGELFSEVSKDLSTLIRQEIALAKAEVSDSAKKAGKGAGMLGGAGYAAHLLTLFLSLALWWALGALIGEGGDSPALGWSALIVAALWGIIAAVLAMMGKKSLEQVEGAPQTTETVKEIPDALKGQESS